MKDILDAEDLELPDYFEVEADVTDFEPVQGITIATNSVFNDLDTEKFDSLDDLSSSMQELQDASSQLVSGSGELKSGIDTLLASSGTLVDGIGQLTAGGEALHSGAGQLAAGGNALAEGNAALADGTGQLLGGAQTLASGASQLNTGLLTAANQTQNVLLPGVKALDAGISQMQESLETQLPALCDGIAQLNAAVNGEKDSLSAGAEALSAGAEQLSGGISEARKELSEKRSELLQMVGGQNPTGLNPSVNTADLGEAAVSGAADLDAAARSRPPYGNGA